MWKDPIVAEVRKVREQYAAKFGNDLDRIFADIKRREALRKKAAAQASKKSGRPVKR